MPVEAVLTSLFVMLHVSVDSVTAGPHNLISQISPTILEHLHTIAALDCNFILANGRLPSDE